MEVKTKLQVDYDAIRQFSIFILFVTIPFYRSFSSIVIGLIFLLSFVEIWKNKSLPRFQIHWFLPSLFLYYIISLAISGGTWPSFEKLLLLIAIPLLVWFNYRYFKYQTRIKFYLSFILGNLLVFLYCLIVAINKSIVITNGQWTFNPMIGESNHDFLTSAIMGGNYLFGEDFSYFLHPAYFGLYVVFIQYLIFEIYKTTSGKVHKLFLVGFYLFFFIVLFMLSSKAAIISSLILTFCLIFFIRLPLLIKACTLTAIVIFSVLFVFLNPRMRIFKDTFTTGLSINPEARFGHDLRILSWDASIEVIKDNWLLGVGEANKEEALVKIYKAKGYIVPAQEMFNSHNQYLDFLVGGGLVGIGLYLTGLTLLLIKSYKENNYTLLAFVLIFSFAAFFENLLARYAGILFFSVFVSVLSTWKKPLSNQNKFGSSL
jgi:hypothetical protein